MHTHGLRAASRRRFGRHPHVVGGGQRWPWERSSSLLEDFAETSHAQAGLADEDQPLLVQRHILLCFEALCRPVPLCEDVVGFKFYRVFYNLCKRLVKQAWKSQMPKCLDSK